MKTLLAAAEPAGDVRPTIMIVDSTPQQRAAWHVMCQMIGVRHHFVGVDSALGRLKEGFPVAGVILDHDPSEGITITPEKSHFLQELMATDYRGPLVGANLLPDGLQQFMLQHVARRLGIELLIDDQPSLDRPGALGFSDILRWCLERR